MWGESWFLWKFQSISTEEGSQCCWFPFTPLQKLHVPKAHEMEREEQRQWNACNVPALVRAGVTQRWCGKRPPKSPATLLSLLLALLAASCLPLYSHWSEHREEPRLERVVMGWENMRKTSCSFLLPSCSFLLLASHYSSSPFLHWPIFEFKPGLWSTTK